MPGQRCKKSGCKNYALKNSDSGYCRWHVSPSQRRDEMESRKEELLGAGDKFGALLEESDTADDMAMADFRREIGEEKDIERQAATDKQVAALKDKIARKQMSFRAYLEECVKIGKTKTIHITDYEWAAWEGKYILNGVPWTLRRGYNELPLELAERIEADRKIATDERWFKMAAEIGERGVPDYIQGVGQVATAGMLKTETLRALLGSGNPNMGKQERQAQIELAKKIAKAAGKDATLPPGPGEVEYK